MSWPVQRTEKVSGAMEGSGEAVDQLRLTWGSVRVSFRLVKSMLSKYWAERPVPVARSERRSSRSIEGICERAFFLITSSLVCGKRGRAEEYPRSADWLSFSCAAEADDRQLEQTVAKL